MADWREDTSPYTEETHGAKSRSPRGEKREDKDTSPGKDFRDTTPKHHAHFAKSLDVSPVEHEPLDEATSVNVVFNFLHSL